MLRRRVGGLILGLGLLTLLFSTAPAVPVQAHNPPPQTVTVTSCSGLLEKLNQVHEHNIAAINNCEWSETGWVGGGGHITGESIIEFNTFRAPLDPYSGQPVGWQSLPPYLWSVAANGSGSNSIITNLLLDTGNFPCQFSPNYTVDGYHQFDWKCSSEKTFTGLVDPNSHYAIYDFKVRVWAYFSTVHPAPTVEISADPPVIYPGQNTTLKWASTNADTLSIDNGVGSVAAPSGSKQVGPLNQDTTYKITATGSGGTADATVTVRVQCSVGLAPPTKKLSFFDRLKQHLHPQPALAQTSSCKPDLTISLDQIQVVMKDDLGKTYTQTPPSVNYGDEIQEITLKNVKVTNSGLAKFTGKASVAISKSDPFTAPEWEKNFDFDLAPNQSAAIDLIVTANGDGFYPAADLLSDQTWSDLYAAIDRNRTVDESYETNNVDSISKLFSWPLIKVHLQSSDIGTAYLEAKHGSNGWVAGADVDTPMIAMSLNQPVTEYTSSVQIGDDNVPGPKVTVSDNKLYTVNIANTDGWLIFKDIYLETDSKNQLATESQVTITPTNGKAPVTKDQANGMVAFRVNAKTGIAPGQYKVSMKATLIWGDDTGGSFKEVGRANYTFPQPSGSTGKELVSAISGQTVSEKYTLKLTKECALDQQVNYCFKDTPERIIQLKNSPIFPEVKKQVQRLRSFALFPATIKEVSFVFDPFGDGAAYYDPQISQTSLFIESSYALETTLRDVADSAVHELFHLLDDAAVADKKDPGDTFLTDINDQYFDLLKDQFINGTALRPTGQKLWDLILFGCSYETPNCQAGYTSNLIVTGVNRFSVDTTEAFAEEKATVCIYKNQVMDRLTNVTTLWQQKVGTPPPADLLATRDVIVKRLTLLENPDHRIGTWHNECLGVSGGGKTQ